MSCTAPRWHTRRQVPFVFSLCVLLAALSCHDSPRRNPLDPVLTPPVALLSVEADSHSGTAVLTWTRYQGRQEFGEYLVERRLAGQIATETRRTVADPSDTSFVDSGLEVDRTYVYTVSVVNSAGLQVGSNQVVVPVPFEAPQIQDVSFDSRTASATVTWFRSGIGLEHYEVHRQTEGEPGVLIVERITAAAETTYTDTVLDGNTVYTYTVVARSTTGRELPSDAAF